jgi:hypothetical protein
VCKRKVLVDKDSLFCVLDEFWYEARKQYIAYIRDEEIDCVGTLDDDHVFVTMLSLAEACGSIESAEQEIEEIREECGLVDDDADDDDEDNDPVAPDDDNDPDDVFDDGGIVL